MENPSGVLKEGGSTNGAVTQTPENFIELFMNWAINFAVSRVFFVRDIFAMFFNFVISLILLKGNQWKYTKRVIIHQLIFSGIDALYVLGITAAIVGGVVMVQVFSYSTAFQTDILLMQILVSLIIKELAPILTALILVGRSGSAITVELGSMKIKRHHEALESMGIDLYQYFHLPRVIGLAVSTVVLTGYFIIITLISAVFISLFKEDLNMWTLFTMFTDSVLLSDVLICILKGFILGTIIALICIYNGLQVKASATEIPQRTSEAVVTSFRMCWIVNGAISFIWYAIS